MGRGSDVDVRAEISSASHRSGPEIVASVVVSTRDRAGHLAEMLAALEAQVVGPDRFEVIVVDDGSLDDTWAVLVDAAHRDTLRLLARRLATSVGQGQGRNVGLAACTGAIVAFTDDDCLPAPGWLGAIVAPFGEVSDGTRPGAPRVVQGRTVPWPGDAETTGPWARSVWVLGPTWLFETCNIAYRLRDLQSVGGFPARGDAPCTVAGKAVGEDALTGWRVMDLGGELRGGELRFAADAQVYHRNEAASYFQWLVALRGRAAFPELVGRSPHGRRAMWGRWFLARRTAAVDAVVLSLVMFVASGHRRWLAGLIPWVWLALPEAAQRGGRHPVVRLAQIGIGDLVSLRALVGASVRHRTLVL